MAICRYIRKSAGDSPSPCGIPKVVLKISPSLPCRRAVRVVWDSRYLIMRSSDGLLRRSSSNFVMSIDLSIQSKAFDKSIPIMNNSCWYF